MSASDTQIILSHDGVELARHTLPPGAYVIGRSIEANLHVETPLLSRQHARLTIGEQHIFLEDLGSANGTFVAEQPISDSTRLFPEQSVRLGDITLEIRREVEPVASEPNVEPAPAGLRNLLPAEIVAESRYAIGSTVARGGMGAILNALECPTKRTVAMKVMLESADADDVMRFVEEAQVTAQLEHPNIVPIHELSVNEQDQLYYTMKMVRGITLKKVLELLAEGTPATIRKYQLPALLTVFQKVCDAVAFAHNKGVIHRDLKPENVMIGDFGEVLLMDWGLAKILGKDDAASVPRHRVTTARSAKDPSTTIAGTIMGTPYYMSPEQAAGEIHRLDPRSDIYSLGAMLFEILHLRYVVAGTAVEDVLENVRKGRLDWPDPKATCTQLRKPKGKIASHLPGGHVPDSLLAVCRKALSLDPAARYGRVDELQADMEAYQHGFATSAEKTSPLKNIWLLLRRRKVESIATALVLVTSIGFGTRAVVQGRRAEKAFIALKQTAPDLLRLAESDANFQNYAAAQKSIDAALAIDPTLKDGYWRRAWALLAQEKFSEAADALRLAQQKDPARAARARILPQVEQMAGATTDDARWDTGLVTSVFNHLREVGASGESAFFARHLRLSTDERINQVRQRVQAWIGKDGGTVSKTATGFLEVRIKPGAASTLDGLRGVPIDILDVGTCKITTLEPLRGMRLAKLILNGNPITDLTPLTGMSLFDINLGGTPVSDLTPLAGMPLQNIDLGGTQVNDVAALRGAPLERFMAGGTRLVDLSPLAGAPLKDVSISGSRVSDLRFLENAPIAILNIINCGSIRDISPLRGRPLVRLEMNGTGVVDLRPLAGLPIKVLGIDNCKKISDFSPLLDLPNLERISCFGLPQALEVLRKHPTLKFIAYQFPGENGSTDRTVADFWKLYDTRAQSGSK